MGVARSYTEKQIPSAWRKINSAPRKTEVFRSAQYSFWEKRMEVFSTSSSTLSAVEQWGLAVIHHFQKLENPLLTSIIKAFSDFFGIGIVFFLLPILYWCFSEKSGIKLFLAVFFTVAVNTALKLLLAVPRPFQVDPSVYIVAESGFSSPSGHAQITATFWVLAALLIPINRSKKGTIIRICTAVIIPLLVGLTRIYLGVHYPTDVFFGWFLGAGIAFITYYLLIIIKTIFFSQKRQIRTLVFAILTASLIHSIGPFQSGLIFGFGMGYLIILDSGGFSARLGNLHQKVIRLAAGTLSVAALSYALMMLLALFQDTFIALGLMDILLFTSTTLVGFFVTFILPKIFIRTGIALNNDNPFGADTDSAVDTNTTEE